MPPARSLDLVAESAELRARLAEAEDMLRAIRRGEIDALVTQSDTGPRVDKWAEEELRHSERLHRIAFDLAPIGLVYVALDGQFMQVNARMCEITGYAADELLHMTVGDLTHPDDRAHDNELLRPFLSGSTPSYANEKRYVRKDGSSRWVSVTARMVTDDAGQPLHTVGAIRDIQERIMADAALRTSETRYRRLFEAAHDGVLILDPATRKIVDANPFMTTLLGYSHDELIGMELYQIGFLADAQASRDMFQNLTATRQVRYEDLPLQTQKGGLREVEVVANLYDEAGHSVVQCNVRDITERKAAKAALLENEERQTFLLKLSDAIRLLGDPLEVQTAALRVLGEHLGVNRAFYLEIDDERDAYVILRTYANGVAPLTGQFPLSEMPRTAELASLGQIVVYDEASADPRLSAAERAAFAAMEMAAGVGVPLIKDGRWVAGLGVHHATPRHWTPEEIDLIRETAERTWARAGAGRGSASVGGGPRRFPGPVDRRTARCRER